MGSGWGYLCYEFSSFLRPSHLRKALFSILMVVSARSKFAIPYFPPYPPTPFHPRRGGKGSLEQPIWPRVQSQDVPVPRGVGMVRGFG